MTVKLLGASDEADELHLFDPLNDEPYAVCGATIAVLHVNLTWEVWRTMPDRCPACVGATREPTAQDRMNEAMLHGQSFMMGHGDRASLRSKEE